MHGWKASAAASQPDESFYVTAPLIGGILFNHAAFRRCCASFGFSWVWIFYALKTSNLQLRASPHQTAPARC
jgi:hypothetical protein